MASLNAVIGGLEILEKYLPDGKDAHSISAEHDIIYAGPSDDGVSEEDRKRLDDLGWHYDMDVESWARFV